MQGQDRIRTHFLQPSRCMAVRHIPEQSRHRSVQPRTQDDCSSNAATVHDGQGVLAPSRLERGHQ